MVWFNMEAIPKSDIKSDIRFGNRFDIKIKQTTQIGHISQAYIREFRVGCNLIIVMEFFKSV